jgi:hypothetical protein
MHISCTAVHFIQLGAVVFAVLAALFWFCASLVKMPSLHANSFSLPDGDLGPVSDALWRQNRLNALAAACAAISAICQGALVYAPTCISLI